jgi:hypothetical protein
MAGKPIADPGMKCPFWRRDRSKVCHTCELWVSLIGKNPNTGKDVEDWHCAFSWGPLLQVEVANQVRQETATVDALRNEVQQFKSGLRQDFLAVAQAVKETTRELSRQLPDYNAPNGVRLLEGEQP